MVPSLGHPKSVANFYRQSFEEKYFRWAIHVYDLGPSTKLVSETMAQIGIEECL